MPNDVAYPLIETESTVLFDGVEYVIRQANETNAGNRTVKKVEAVERFFVDMLDAPQPRLHTGSMTFEAALNFVFEYTGYSFNVVDSGFYAERFENFGRTNALALFRTVLERYGAEFTVNSKTVTIYKERGAKTDFQLRYGMNVKAIDKQVETHNLATAIEGYGGEPDDDGNYPVHETYISPNADLYPTLRWAEPVVDERFTTVSGMRAHLKSVLIDEPQMSMTVDFADLRAAGYTPLVPNEGDWGYIVYEPMNFTAEARIVKITEQFDALLRPQATTVEVSNIRQRLSDTLTRFSQTTKSVNQLLSGQKKLPFNVLDDAVKIATRALQSAQTELKFDNGIIAIDKNNANNLVLFNSAGIGISDDAGATFKTAMTGHGIVADVITSGTMLANRISGGVLSSLNSNTVFNLNTGKLDMENADFTLGGQANLFFADRGNRIFYQKRNGQTLRSSGIGVGDSLNDRYPLVFLGVSTADKPQASDQTNFSGFIANATERVNDDANGNSANGLLFDVRDKPVNYTKGFRFDLRSNSPSLLTFRNDLYDYDFGVVNRLLTKKGFTLRNYGNEQSGWLMETNYSGSGDAITLRGLNGGTYVYQIGADATNHRIRNIYLANHPNVESDERLKEDVKDSNLGLSFINDIQPKTFRFKPKGGIKERTHFGVLAQQLEHALSEHGVDIDDVSIVSRGSDGYYGVEYNQLIIPIIKAIQELALKIDDITEVTNDR